MTDRLQPESGFTMIELLIAMLIMIVGIFAIAAGFSSGLVNVQRGASRTTAGQLADQQMEQYRNLSFSAIAIDSIPSGNYTTDDATAYKSGTACSATPNLTCLITATCPGVDTTALYRWCNPSWTTTSNNISYRIDSYVSWSCASTLATQLVAVSGVWTCEDGSSAVYGNAVKLVTVDVRNGSTTTQTLFSEASTFDATDG